MDKVRFAFSTKLTFDNNVYNHYFALRCTPQSNSAQKITALEFSISPFVSCCVAAYI